MSTSSPLNNPETLIESIHDEPPKERRRILGWILLALVIFLLAGAGITYAITSQPIQPVEMENYEGEDQPPPTQPQPPTSVPTQVPTLVPTTVPTDVPTEVPAAATDEPTPVVASGVTPVGVTPVGVTEPPQFPWWQILTVVGPTVVPPSGDVCANNGGLQWQGEFCTCGGVIDKITICADGAKTDTLTTTGCTPNPADCPAPTEEPPPPPDNSNDNVCTCFCYMSGHYYICYDTCTGASCDP